MSADVYYNEFDPKAAAWLRELIRQGHLPAGDVDERSIADVRGSDLAGYRQCHFFAGIGGWPYALMLAGWPAERPVWTGSCPCQPFSCAGKGKGTADERHLWPEFARLIGECKPSTVFGEQVASKAGREWLAGVFADLEGLGYAVAGADLCAAGVGAPHIRQRLFWVADMHHTRQDHTRCWMQGKRWAQVRPTIYCASGRLTNPEHDGSHRALRPAPESHSNGQDGRVSERGDGAGAWLRVIHACECDEDGDCPVCGIDYGDCPCPGPTQEDKYEYDERPDGLFARRLEYSIFEGLEGLSGHGAGWNKPGRIVSQSNGSATSSSGAGFWSDFDILPFRDGKARRVESGTFPLADRAPARVVRLRGYGNAIVPQVAAEFIKACAECLK